MSRKMALRRALHFVFKIGDRAKTATFYRDVLGMKVCVSKVEELRILSCYVGTEGMGFFVLNLPYLNTAGFTP